MMKELMDNIIPGIQINDILDILIVAFIIYKLLGLIRQSRAEQLVKGLLLLVVVMVLSGFLHLYTIHWILTNTMTVGLVALVVVFQPELRRALEHLGRGKWLQSFRQVDKTEAQHIVTEIVDAVESASATKTGMLLVFERQTALEDICETGTIINSDITTELIGNIFYEGAPLHDGAVIVRYDKLYAAGCVLPLSEDQTLPRSLGTRHKAGIGITEKSDAFVVIVSEETGIISYAKDGHITRYVDTKTVEKELLNVYFNEPDDEKLRNVKKAIDKAGGKKDVQ